LWIVPEHEPGLRALGLDSIDRLFADDLGERLDKPGLATWRQRRRVRGVAAGQEIVLYVKRFTNPPCRATRQARSTSLGVESTAGAEWAWMHRLAQLAIPGPQAVAFGAEFNGRREARSVVVSASVPGQSLEKWAECQPEFKRRLHEIVHGTADLVRRFHANGLIHRDLYLSHIFFNPAQRGPGALTLIDLQRVFCPKWARRRWLVKDLASLNYSVGPELCTRADRLRWFCAYLGVRKLRPPDRRLAYRTIGKTLRIARKTERRRAVGPMSSTSDSEKPGCAPMGGPEALAAFPKRQGGLDAGSVMRDR
jgi:hypothetical protein